MINKRKPIRREVRCLYMALLKNNKGVRDLRKMIGFFDEYIDLRDRVVRSGDVPPSVRAGLIFAIKMPKYLKWAKKYLIKGEKK